jgi:hypothetical protein
MNDGDEKEPIVPALPSDNTSAPPNEERPKVVSFEGRKNKAQQDTKDPPRRVSLTHEQVGQLTTPQKHVLLLRAVLSDDTTDSELARMPCRAISIAKRGMSG